MGYDYYGGYGFAPYVSVAELKKKASAYVQKEAKAGNILHPIVLEGRTIAKNWWGKTWIENLERYADYASRLERGRKYVRANCVVDLQIEGGLVNALVMGSGKKPYRIRVNIDQIGEEKYEEVTKKCASKIQNLDSLINGKFPEELKELFSRKGGIFPTMSEIHFFCSCPDYADMCKHVASVLYAIGAKFDSDPMLFFTLRGIDTEKLVGGAIESKIEMMMKNAGRLSERILADSDMADLFGV